MRNKKYQLSCAHLPPKSCTPQSEDTETHTSTSQTTSSNNLQLPFLIYAESLHNNSTPRCPLGSYFILSLLTVVLCSHNFKLILNSTIMNQITIFSCSGPKFTAPSYSYLTNSATWSTAHKQLTYFSVQIANHPIISPWYIMVINNKTLSQDQAANVTKYKTQIKYTYLVDFIQIKRTIYSSKPI